MQKFDLPREEKFETTPSISAAFWKNWISKHCDVLAVNEDTYHVFVENWALRSMGIGLTLAS